MYFKNRHFYTLDKINKKLLRECNYQLTINDKSRVVLKLIDMMLCKLKHFGRG